MREDLDADAEDGGGRALCATGAVDVEAFEDIVGIGVQRLRFQIQDTGHAALYQAVTVCYI